MNKWLKICFFLIIAGVIVWGLITPNSIRAAFANNLWSLKFMQKYYGTDSSEHEFLKPPKMHVNSGFFLASQAMRQNDLELAKEYLTPLVEKRDPVALNNYAEILYLQQDYAGAFQIWEELGDISRLLVVVDEMIKIKRWDLRTLAWQRLYNIDPERFTLSLADSLVGEHEYNSAIVILERSIQDYPMSTSTSLWLNQLENIDRYGKD